jgi:hypothetical protein
MAARTVDFLTEPPRWAGRVVEFKSANFTTLGYHRLTRTVEIAMKGRSFGLVCFIALTSACYHATIDTGLVPSTQTIEKPWASGWIYGLVPPSPIETAQKCPNGVAKIDTQLSFANQLVDFLTLGIYTPMDIKVTCAQSRTSSLPMIRAGSDIRAAFEAAVRLSYAQNQPVLLSY